MGEALMLELGREIGRQRAHDVIYDAAQAAATSDSSFRELLAADPRVTEQLTPEAVDALLDPSRYTGLSARMAVDGARYARAIAGICGRDE